jgi:FdhE protein
VAMSERDLQVLRALEAAQEQHTALDDLLSFYHDIYQVQFQAKQELPDPEVRDEIARLWRLEGGIPELTFDQLGVDPAYLNRLVGQIVEVFVLHDHPALQASDGPWTPQELVAHAQQVFETWDTLMAPHAGAVGTGGPATGGLTAQAVGFALGTYLQRAAERILPHLDLSLWTRGYCPICGGRPNLALLGHDGASRHLVCSRCTGEWAYPGTACPFCESEETQTYYVSEDGLYHLFVCPGCKAYLKAVDVRRAQRDIYPLVEHLLTVGMDLAARQESYDH